MPSLQRLPTSAMILICDARKALFLRNDGTAIHPSLTVLETLIAETVTEDRDLSGNPPGRMPDSGGTRGPRSAMEQPDFSRLDEEKFAAAISTHGAGLFDSGGFDGVVVAAPSRMLGALRQALAPRLRGALLAEIPKDLTRQPVDEISGHLVEGW